MLLKDALNEWLDRKARTWSPKTAKFVRTLAEGWLSVLGGEREVREATTGDVERLEAQRDDGLRSASALNQERTYLRAFFRWCALRGWCGADPTVTWAFRRPVVKREYAVLSREEENRLVEAAPEWLARYVRLAVCTGLREGTIRQLTWGMLHGDVLEIPGRIMKARRPHRIPVPQRALAALGEPGAKSAPLCPLPIAERVYTVFKRVVAKTGVNPVASPHDLRRTWVARLSERGTPLQVVQKLGGWKTASTLLTHYCGEVPEAAAREVLAGV